MKDICNKVLSGHSTIKRAMGKVESINSTYTMAGVSIVGSNALVTLPNKTNQILEVGDYVWVHYWQNITDGYVAFKNGQGDYMLNVGEGVNNSTISIDNAFLLREGSHEYITTHTYDLNDSYGVAPFPNTPMNVTRTGDYYPDLCAMLDARYPGRDNSKYCYLYQTDRTLADGTTITIGDVPGRHLQAYNPVSNNFAMFSSVQINSFTLVSTYHDTEFVREYYLEPKTIYLDYYEDAGGRYVAAITSDTPHLHPDVVIISKNDVDLSHWKMTFTMEQYDFLGYGDRLPYDFPYCVAPSFIPYISTNYYVDCLNIGILHYENGSWELVGKVAIEYPLIVPLYTTTTDAHTHVGNMVDTKERSVVV